MNRIMDPEETRRDFEIVKSDIRTNQNISANQLNMALDRIMPNIDFEKQKITYIPLKNTANDWVYPHMDTLIYNDELLTEEFKNIYIPLYALKNKAEILKIMFNLQGADFRYRGLIGEYLSGGGGMKNQEVKKCEKKKVVLGKERCIYKVSGSKKDYMKYKGKLVPVTDYVKYMKKKN